jgi:uncharacterized LabA/DUF88 family protein
MMEKERVIAYIDGYNLYFGLKAAGWQRYLWLNLPLLAKNLLKPNQNLVFTKYFTSMVTYPEDKLRRQTLFIDALRTQDNFEIFFGQFQTNPRLCRNCGNKEYVPQEKMTDVNIAVEMMKDAYQNAFDTALLISGDGDLTAPLVAIKDLFPEKRIIVAFPPQRKSYRLQEQSHGHFIIGRNNFAKSVFPNEIKTSKGHILKCPDGWR